MALNSLPDDDLAESRYGVMEGLILSQRAYLYAAHGRYQDAEMDLLRATLSIEEGDTANTDPEIIERISEQIEAISNAQEAECSPHSVQAPAEFLVRILVEGAQR